METPHRTILIAANDIIVREICARYLNSCGFVCRCINFDETLLTHLGKIRPHALISELSLLSRYYSRTDLDSAFCLLLAARCKLPGLPVFTVHNSESWDIAERSRKLEMAGHFTYPVDLAKLVTGIRLEIRRLTIAARRPGGKGANDIYATPGNSRRGRPRKYPQEVLQAPVTGIRATSFV